MSIKAYKGFNSDMTCQGFKFEVGNEYRHHGNLKMCVSGFHYCENLLDVYNYYQKTENTIICEVEDLSNNTIKEDDKSVTDHIKIIRKLSDKELLRLWINKSNSGYRNSGDYNSGDCNSGYRNSGDCNSGSYNSGDCNSGSYNSGNRNSGHYNSGYYNSGNCNSGNRNSGHYNSGHYNSGDRNSGYYNSGNYNSGYFNTNSPEVRLFNKDSKLLFNDKRIVSLRCLNIKPILQWVPELSMTEEEKNNNPSYEATGGYLKNTGRNDYRFLTKENVNLIKSLPNFDDKIFKEITGISIGDIKYEN